MDRYDAVIVGAGQAGVPLARDLAGAGLAGRAGRARARGRHLLQRGVHPHQDHGRQRPGGLPGAPGRRIRGADRAGGRRPGRGAAAEAGYRRELALGHGEAAAGDPGARSHLGRGPVRLARRRSWSTSGASAATAAERGAAAPPAGSRPDLREHRRSSGRTGYPGAWQAYPSWIPPASWSSTRCPSTGGARCRIRGPRVRPDVPAFRQRGDRGAARWPRPLP